MTKNIPETTIIAQNLCRGKLEKYLGLYTVRRRRCSAVWSSTVSFPSKVQGGAPAENDWVLSTCTKPRTRLVAMFIVINVPSAGVQFGSRKNPFPRDPCWSGSELCSQPAYLCISSEAYNIAIILFLIRICCFFQSMWCRRQTHLLKCPWSDGHSAV